jgi:LmbE family N-acetylglucosaminyl deacetylase
VVTAAIVGDGTTEDVWSPWLVEQRWPQVDLAAVAGRRVIVLAAHPDDEVLGVGGLMVRLASLQHDIVVVWATDGEASHPGSMAMPESQLGQTRREESRRAIAQLGVTPTSLRHLGLPDGGLASADHALYAELSRLVRPDDLVIAPWSQDGHPDHDVLGATAAMLGSVTWHYPIWMWHWAVPGDLRVPWQRLHSSKVVDVNTKAAAISAFTSQVEPLGPAVEDAAILPPHVVARFIRPYEWIFT